MEFIAKRSQALVRRTGQTRKYIKRKSGSVCWLCSEVRPIESGIRLTVRRGSQDNRIAWASILALPNSIPAEIHPPTPAVMRQLSDATHWGWVTLRIQR